MTKLKSPWTKTCTTENGGSPLQLHFHNKYYTEWASTQKHHTKYLTIYFGNTWIFIYFFSIVGLFYFSLTQTYWLTGNFPYYDPWYVFLWSYVCFTTLFGTDDTSKSYPSFLSFFFNLPWHPTK